MNGITDTDKADLLEYSDQAGAEAYHHNSLYWRMLSALTAGVAQGGGADVKQNFRALIEEVREAFKDPAPIVQVGVGVITTAGLAKAGQYASECIGMLASLKDPVRAHMWRAEEAVGDEVERETIRILAGRLCDEVAKVRASCGFDGQFMAKRDGEPNGHDLLFADYLDGFGERGREAAESIREGAAEDWGWSLWIDLDRELSIGPWLGVLASALWHDTVKGEWQRAREMPVQTFPRIFHRSVRAAMTPGARIDEGDSQTLIYPRAPRMITPVAHADRNLTEQIRRGFKALQTVPGHKTLKGVWRHAYRGWRQTGQIVPMRIEHGQEGLAKAFRVTKGKATKKILTALEGGAHLVVEAGTGERRIRLDGLWTLAHVGRSTLIITPNSFFIPSGQSEIDADPWLVTTSDDESTPLVGRANEHACQLSFHMRLHEFLSDNAGELAQRGSVGIAHTDFLDMADETGVSRKILDEVITAIVSPGSTDLFPLLRRESEGRYLLADGNAHAFYVEQGNILNGARAGGIARSRAARRNALGQFKRRRRRK